MTGNDVISHALILINRLHQGQVASGDEMALGQIHLNNLIDEWNAQGLTIYSAAPQTFNLSNGVRDYTIGTGATFNTPRPVRIQAWAVKTTSGQAVGGTPVDAETFARIATDRSAVGARVKALNYDAAFPIASIHLHPAPTGGTLEIWTWDQLAQITNFATVLALPPAFQQALIFNLALRLGPVFERPIDQRVSAGAESALAAMASSGMLEMRTAAMPAPAPQQAPPAPAPVAKPAA